MSEVPLYLVHEKASPSLGPPKGPRHSPRSLLGEVPAWIETKHGHPAISWMVGHYRVTSRIRNTHPPRITIGPYAEGYSRVLLGGGVLVSEVPL